jgi:hypothetical protein
MRGGEGRRMAADLTGRRGREVLPLMVATAYNLRNKSGSFAMFTAIRWASSLVSSLAAVR